MLTISWPLSSNATGHWSPAVIVTLYYSKYYCTTIAAVVCQSLLQDCHLPLGLLLSQSGGTYTGHVTDCPATAALLLPNLWCYGMVGCESSIAVGVRPQLTFLFIVSHECRANEIVKWELNKLILYDMSAFEQEYSQVWLWNCAFFFRV